MQSGFVLNKRKRSVMPCSEKRARLLAEERASNAGDMTCAGELPVWSASVQAPQVFTNKSGSTLR
jgi:hypothetical protein